MGITRKLEDVHRDLTLLAGQGMAVGFLTNTENADRINGLVEDIREVMMDYQVRSSSYSFLPYLTFALDFIATRYLRQELSAHCESHPLTSYLCKLTEE